MDAIGVENSRTTDETATPDVIVVGGVGSGLAAAITAAGEGAQVLLLEKNPALGGSTAWSVGSYSASRTLDQRRAGIGDSAEAHFEDMGKFIGEWSARDNLAMRRLLAEEAGPTLEGLSALGVRFFGPVAEPPHRVPRMHNVLPNSAAYIYHLGREAKRVGVDIRTSVEVAGLIVDGGEVKGVRIRKDGKTTELFARRAVVLAGGDYSASSELKDRFGAGSIAGIPPVNPTATGECHRLALELGARVVNGDVTFGPIVRFLAPRQRTLTQRLPPWSWLMGFAAWSLRNLPADLLRPFILGFMTTVLGPEMSLFEDGALLVGSEGTVLALDGRTPGDALPTQPDNLGYILLDAQQGRYR